MRLITQLMLVLLAMWWQPTDMQPITADNIAALGSVSRIDYADAPDAAGELATGWLRVSNDGAQVVTINRANDLLLWDITSDALLDTYRVEGVDGTNANMLDVMWKADDTAVHSLHTDGTNSYVAAYRVADGDLRVIEAPVSDDLPVRVWADNDADYTWVEVMPADSRETPYVMRLSLADGSVDVEQDSAPEADSDAAVRIGRMPAPLAVTSTEDGSVVLWDMEAGGAISEVGVEGMPMFGHINGAAGRRLVWRDPQSEALQLLDFVGGENQVIAPLDGAYLQALLLTPSADVVLGVNVNLEPVVVAWEVETGALRELGAYRDCGRTPDMIQLSTDGTTLVIGCDTGLDIWRVGEVGE